MGSVKCLDKPEKRVCESGNIIEHDSAVFRDFREQNGWLITSTETIT